MHRLQAVADIRQRAPDDHAHRIVEIRSAHLVFDVDGDQVSTTAVPAERHLGRRCLGRILVWQFNSDLVGIKLYFTMWMAVPSRFSGAESVSSPGQAKACPTWAS